MKLVIKPDSGSKWFEISDQGTKQAQLADDLITDNETKLMTKAEIAEIQKKAEKLLFQDVEAYKTSNTKGDKRADFQWMDKIMRTGTIPDKMAAYTVRIQDSPVHNLNCIQQLLGMVKTQGKQQCLSTADTARDLFLEDLLPPGKKLISFDQRGVLLRSASNKQLILWIFEDKLKAQYASFVDSVRKMSVDTIDKIRGKAISIIHQLLASHPEQEHVLLPILVNKLGDPVRKVGSRALFHLNKLLTQHPQMKIIVVGEVERLLFRNNVAKRAQYYGICFLNTIRLEGDEGPLGVKLVKVYLGFFKACVKTGEIDSKMMGALLNGVNKAFPVARNDGFEFTESIDTLYKIVQLSHFNIGVNALSLLFQIIDVQKNPSQADRYYRILYRKLLDTEVSITSQGIKFLNVVYKAMRGDNLKSRVVGFTKRLLQLCNNLPANLSCSILFLLSEVSKTHTDILNIGSNISIENITCKIEPNLDEDIKESNIDLNLLQKSTNVQFNSLEEPEAPVEVTDEEVQEIKTEKEQTPKSYDPFARNPTYSGAESTLAYELVSLTHHYHPSVALFSQTLLNNRSIKYDGNPLKDFTLSRFLERFVYRNPKAKRVKQEYQPQGLRNLPVTSSVYLKSDEKKIPIEEKFFYKYFKDRLKTVEKDKKTKKDEEFDSDVESVGDEEFEDLMQNYFKSNGALAEPDLDFASEITKTKSKGKRKKVESDDEEDSDDIESGEDNDADEFVELNSDEEPEFDYEDGDNFEDDEEVRPTKSKSKPNRKLKGNDMFVPAEQFSELLESNADVAFSGSHTLINKDNSNLKQLKWETDRDRWVKGFKKTSKTKFVNNKRRKLK